MSLAGKAITLNGFAEILEAIAADPRGPESSADTGYADWVRHSVAAGGTKLRVLRYMLAHASQPGSGEGPRLLDVGAQVGAMAAYAAQLGFRVAALDLPHYARRFSEILRPYGVAYHTCDLRTEPLPFADACFDFVTYMDVIEHHAFSPRRILQEIRRVLAPGGRVIITTPNHASIYNRVSLLLGRSVNDNFPYFFESCGERELYPGHHREYTLAELRRALELSGFCVAEARVFDEDPASLRYFLQQQKTAATNGNARGGWRERANYAAAIAGKAMEAVRLPWGRLLWAVGQKPPA